MKAADAHSSQPRTGIGCAPCHSSCSTRRTPEREKLGSCRYWVVSRSSPQLDMCLRLPTLLPSPPPPPVDPSCAPLFRLRLAILKRPRRSLCVLRCYVFSSKQPIKAVTNITTCIFF